MKALDKKIIREFCLGIAPSAIDRRNFLPNGTAHKVIVTWWADDKWNRTGGIQKVLGSGWKDMKFITR